MRDREDNPAETIRDRHVASFLRVSHVTVLSWRRGEKTPEPANQARLELLFARTDADGNPILRADGRVESDLPREMWSHTAAAEAA